MVKGVINMAKLEQTKTKKDVDSRFLSVIFDKDFPKESLQEKEKSKIELFEKGLAGEISRSDTIEQTVEKIVKMALTCEFGASLITKPGAKKMVSTISRGIISDSTLRRSALIIADRFANSEKSKVIKLRGKTVPGGRQEKVIING
jgi:adenosylcobinamide amidohydrolase